VSIEKPEYNSPELEGTNYDRAIRLYDISGNAGGIVRDFLMEHPELLKDYPEIATLASEIAGMVFKEICDLLGIPEEIQSKVSNDGE
jgi:hypothetical protein